MFLIVDRKHGSARSARSAYVIGAYIVAWQPLISTLLVATSQPIYCVGIEQEFLGSSGVAET